MINNEKIYILVPPIQALARDNNQTVRSLICDVISTVIPLVGKEISVSKLYPYLLELVEDKETDVRIRYYQEELFNRVAASRLS